MFADVSANDNNIYKIAKQMERNNQDVAGEKCIKNDGGELMISDEGKLKAWVEHYDRLLNVEFEWPRELLPEALPVVGPPPHVTVELVSKALKKMKLGKAAGPSGITADMLVR